MYRIVSYAFDVEFSFPLIVYFVYVSQNFSIFSSDFPIEYSSSSFAISSVPKNGSFKIDVFSSSL